MQAPPERLAYVAALNPPGGTLNDAMLVIDVDPASANYGKRVGQTVLPNAGDELHHFGWNACSSAFVPMPHIRISSDATWLCRASALRESTSWISSPILGIPRS